MNFLDSRAYVTTLISEGQNVEGVTTDLISMGWHRSSAQRIVKDALDGGPVRRPLKIGPDLEKLPSTVALEGVEAQVQMRMHLPNICILSNFVTAQECEKLIETARPRLARSMVILGDGEIDEEGVSAYSRTSEQMSFTPGDFDLIDQIMRRATQFANWSLDCVESPQVIRYGVGADFAPHHDYFCPRVHADMVAREGQRVGTVIIYLNTPETGGVTAFPDVELEIYPQQGNALFFMYPYPDPDSLTLHAGVPLGSGEKWIATFFFRDKVVKRDKASCNADEPGIV